MQNLPVIYKSVVKSCKVFALIGGLSLCCACADSQPADDAGAGADVAPMSGEVQVSGGEVASNPGGAAPAEVAPDAGEGGGTPAEVSDVASNTGDVADGGKQVAAADSKESAKAKDKSAGTASFADNVRGVRDPFDKFYGKPPVAAAPAPATSTNGSETKNNGAVTSPGGAIGVANAAVNPGDAQGGDASKEGASPAPSAVSDFKVTGILRSNAGYRAILQGADKAAVVAPGDKAFGYRVAAIGDKSVTLVFSNKCKFVLPLQKEEFKSSGEGQVSSSGGSQGIAGGNMRMSSQSR